MIPFGLIFQIIILIIEAVMIFVVTNIAEFCPGDESVHGYFDRTFVFYDRGFCIP